MTSLIFHPGCPVAGAIPLHAAVPPVVGFCTHPKGGWQTYDMLGDVARRQGHFEEIAPWSLLCADTLAGRISVSDVAGFTRERRSDVAGRLKALPVRDLANMDDRDVESLAHLCRFGFPRVWAPKVTKMLALYRPDAVPVLDGYVAMAMGFRRDGFSSGKEPRWERIQQTLLVLRGILRDQQAELAQVREEVGLAVPDIKDATDLRLLDVIIWTSQDDRMSRPGSPTNYRLDRRPQEYLSVRLDPVALH